MKVQFELVIGENKYTLIEDVESNTDFFKKLHFYSSLPKVGPNGETDLQLRYRIAQKQYEYYSIVSEKAGMEFKFGQPKEGKGVLFPKGWEPLFKSEGGEEGSEAPSQGIGLGHTGIGAPTPTPAPAQAAPQGIGAPRAATPTPAPAAAAPKPATPAPAPAAPQVAAQAANILSKFGI